MAYLKKILFIFLTPGVFSTGGLGAFTFQKANWNLPNPFIKDIKVGQNNFYVATAGGLAVVNIKSGASKVYTRNQGLPEDYVTSVDVSADEKVILAGTPSGLAIIEPGGKIDIFNRKNSKISDNGINVVLSDKDAVFVGTKFGVDKYERTLNRWTTYTAIEGLAGNNIQSLVAEGDIIWAGGADGLSSYDKNEDLWISFGPTNGLNSNLITAISLDADAVWVGTAGGGVSRFDRAAQRFEAFGSDFGLADDNVQSLTDDGRYLWVGTFDGLSRLDKQSLRFTNYNAQNGIAETVITSGTVNGAFIFTGTSGGGVYRADKELPQISFSYPKSGYNSAKEVVLVGTTQSEAGISQLQVSYKNAESIKNDWQIKGIKSTNAENGRQVPLCKINSKELADGKYIAQIVVKDKKGRENSMTGSFIIDNTDPQIDLFFRAPKGGEKEIVVTGRYNDLNLTSLSVKVGGKNVPSASLDRQQKRFRFPYNLSQMGRIQVTAEDIGKNKKVIEKDYVVDNEPPVITVDEIDQNKMNGNIAIITGTVVEKNLDQILINPGQIAASFTPLGEDKYAFEAKAAIRSENYTFQVTAFDKSGRSANKALKGVFYSDNTIIELDDDKLPPFTLKTEVEFSGNILGPKLKEFYVETTLQNDSSSAQKTDIKLRPNKSFNQKVRLRTGINTLKLVAVHQANKKDGREDRFERSFTIESNNKDVRASIDNASRSVKDRTAKIRGTYERGITKILVNKNPAQMDAQNLSYEADIALKDGKNAIKVTTIDELGRVKVNSETIFLDNEAPSMILRSLPQQTGLATLKFKGKIDDISNYEIHVFPAGSVEYIDPSTGDFEGKVNLVLGANRIVFLAMDAAGNKIQKEVIIQHDPSFPMREEGEGAGSQEEILALRKEISNLKARLARGIPQGTALTKRKIPETPGLFLVPMAGKIGSYSLISKMYFGNESLSSRIGSYNGVNAASVSVALVPSPQLFELLNTSPHRSSYDAVIRSAGSAYMQTRSRDKVEKSVLRYLTRSRQLKHIEETGSYTLFYTKNGAGVAIASETGGFPQNFAAKKGMKEILVAQVTGKGLQFRKY